MGEENTNRVGVGGGGGEDGKGEDGIQIEYVDVDAPNLRDIIFDKIVGGIDITSLIEEYLHLVLDSGGTLADSVSVRYPAHLLIAGKEIYLHAKPYTR